MTAREQLKSDVKSYAATIESAVSGGEEFFNDYVDEDDAENYDDVYSRLEKYFEDVLDIDFVVSARLEYRGAKILLACGGPAIQLDTNNGCIMGTWFGEEPAEYYLTNDARRAVDDYFAEKWDCVRGCY